MSRRKPRGTGASPSRIARAVTYLGFSFMITWLVGSGRITRIVHPRMIPWMVGAGLLAIVLAAFEVARARRDCGRGDPVSFFYPFAFVLAISALFVQGNSLSPGRVQSSPDTAAFQSAVLRARDEAMDRASTAPLRATIVPDDDTYWAFYNRLYDAPDEAAGHRLVVRGFVFRDKGFPEATILVARNLMWCCSADLAIIGYVARSPTAVAIPDGTWVEVQGRLSAGLFDIEGKGTAKRIPIMEIESIRQVEQEDSPTIFPY
jgi:putative membrane protein